MLIEHINTGDREWVMSMIAFGMQSGNMNMTRNFLVYGCKGLDSLTDEELTMVYTKQCTEPREKEYGKREELTVLKNGEFSLDEVSTDVPNPNDIKTMQVGETFNDNGMHVTVNEINEFSNRKEAVMTTDGDIFKGGWCGCEAGKKMDNETFYYAVWEYKNDNHTKLTGRVHGYGCCNCRSITQSG